LFTIFTVWAWGATSYYIDANSIFLWSSPIFIFLLFENDQPALKFILVSDNELYSKFYKKMLYFKCNITIWNFRTRICRLQQGHIYCYLAGTCHFPNVVVKASWIRSWLCDTSRYYIPFVMDNLMHIKRNANCLLKNL